MIVCNNLSYQSRIQSLTLASAPNIRRLAILGPDGSGKSTLLRLFVQLLKPTTGHCHFLSVNPHHSFYSQVGYLPQKTGLYDDLSVQENLEFYAHLKGVNLIEQQEWKNFLLKTARLEKFTQRRAGALSGGMRQKLALICTLLPQPQLIVLDEPTVGVDLRAKHEIWDMIQLLEDRAQFVWATADCQEAALCHEMWLLDHGQSIFSAPPDDLIHQNHYPIYRSQSNFSPHWRKQYLHDIFSSRVLEGMLDIHGTRVAVLPESVPELPSDWTLLQPTLDDAMLTTYATRRPPLKSGISFPQELSTTEHVNRPVVVVDGLFRNFGSFKAVTPLHFEIQKGEIFGLLGPNGSGKSTTFKMLAGLLPPSGGKAKILGETISPLSLSVRQRIGYMPQKFSLYHLLSVEENLLFFGRSYGVPLSDLKKRIQEMTRLLEFNQFLKRPAGSLSLGLQQRLSFCCALLHYPEIVFLDEPTSGVDPMTRKDFWKLLLGLAEHQITLIVTTHFLDEAQYCDRVLLLLSGQPIAMGSPSELTQQAKKYHSQIHSMDDVFLAHLTHHESLQGVSV